MRHAVGEHVPPATEVYLRQLLSGRDFAGDDELAVQMRNYAYAIGDRESGEALLVDPAYAPGELVELLAGDGMRVVGAVLTHYHADHAGGSMAGHALAEPSWLSRDEEEFPQVSGNVSGVGLYYLTQRFGA